MSQFEGDAAKVSKGRRKRLQRRAERVQKEVIAGHAAHQLSNIVISGLYEIRRRAKAGLEPPVFPFVAELVRELEALFGADIASEVRPLLTAEAANAVAGVVDPRLYRLALGALTRTYRSRSKPILRAK